MHAKRNHKRVETRGLVSIANDILDDIGKLAAKRWSNQTSDRFVEIELAIKVDLFAEYIDLLKTLLEIDYLQYTNNLKPLCTEDIEDVAEMKEDERVKRIQKIFKGITILRLKLEKKFIVKYHSSKWLPYWRKKVAHNRCK